MDFMGFVGGVGYWWAVGGLWDQNSDTCLGRSLQPQNLQITREFPHSIFMTPFALRVCRILP